jgi:putative transposase
VTGSSTPATRRGSRACRRARSCRSWRMRGDYIASESSFYRVLRERGQNHRRGRARPPRPVDGRPQLPGKGALRGLELGHHLAARAGAGMFFYLYLIVDIYSRKIVGWEVHERESAELAARLLERAVWAEGCLTPAR